MMNSLDDAVIVLDHQGTVLFQNTAFRQFNQTLQTELLSNFKQSLEDNAAVYGHKGKLVKRLELNEGCAFIIGYLHWSCDSNILLFGMAMGGYYTF